MVKYEICGRERQSTTDSFLYEDEPIPPLQQVAHKLFFGVSLKFLIIDITCVSHIGKNLMTQAYIEQ